jgi:FkbM family methyltransferase
MIERAKKIIPPIVKNKISKYRKEYLDGYAKKSYSQEGEDMILRRIFEKKEKGFYVDVGAYHPKRFSNTYYFYKKGWKGINIDAMPGSMKNFKKLRPRDINLEFAISNKREKLTYYMFNEPALNGFSEEISRYRENQNNNYKIIAKKVIETKTLKEVLEKFLPTDCDIDFMNIDVEGMDYKVLSSNDWSKYRPNVILVESINTDFQKFENNKIYKFLKKEKYSFFAKTFNTLFFKKDEG